MSLFSGLLGLFGGGSGSNALGASIDNPLKRFLQERSFLIFEFYSGRTNISILPFFENVSINEEQRANFAVYDLIGRAGNMYAYTGSKSRQFKLNFRMTVPHIEHIMKKEGFSFTDLSFRISDQDNKASIRELFINPPSLNNNSPLGNNTTVVSYENGKYNVTKIGYDWSDKAVTDYEALVERDPNLTRRAKIEDIYREDPKVTKRFGYKFNANKKSVNLVSWWINLVRSSTINNSTNSIYGPPIIRLNHGLLYNNVPCICTSYSIKEANNTNYDVPNLFPNVIEVSMSLEEVRDSGAKYKPGTQYADSLAGWNDLQEHRTMDPYNGVWGSA